MELETDALRLEILHATGGVSVTSPRGAFIAQFKNGYVEQGGGVNGRRPVLTARDSDIERLRLEADTELTVRGSIYYVKSVEPVDDPGFSFINLKRTLKR